MPCTSRVERFQSCTGGLIFPDLDGGELPCMSRVGVDRPKAAGRPSYNRYASATRRQATVSTLPTPVIDRATIPAAEQIFMDCGTLIGGMSLAVVVSQ
jgi:hypothetical protein